jgi:hypothetical protein
MPVHRDLHDYELSPFQQRSEVAYPVLPAGRAAASPPMARAIHDFAGALHTSDCDLVTAMGEVLIHQI